MRIAIDAQFRSLPPSGTGSYLEALLRELPDVLDDDDLLAIDRPAKLGAAILPDRLRSDPRALRFWWETCGFGRAASRVSPGLLHIPSFAAPIRSRVPFVVTIHDVIPFVLPEYRASRPMRVHLAAMKRTTRRATLVLTPSIAAAEDIHAVLGVPHHRIRVTPEATDERFRPSENKAVDPSIAGRFGISGRYIFNVGGLDVRKRVDLLIEAFAAARDELPHGTQLVIGGKAHSENPAVFPDLTPLIDRLGLRNDVVLTGWLSNDEKVALYQGAMIYATPSMYEGFGLTPLEAMASGAPVIAADRTSIPEVVCDAGMLLEPDVRSWRDALIALGNDPARRADLTDRGLARAASFSWRRTAELTRDAYRDAVSVSRKG